MDHPFHFAHQQMLHTCRTTALLLFLNHQYYLICSLPLSPANIHAIRGYMILQSVIDYCVDSQRNGHCDREKKVFRRSPSNVLHFICGIGRRRTARNPVMVLSFQKRFFPGRNLLGEDEDLLWRECFLSISSGSTGSAPPPSFLLRQILLLSSPTNYQLFLDHA